MDIKTLGCKLMMLGFKVKILDIHTLISYGKDHCKLYSLGENGKYTVSKLYSDMVGFENVDLIKIRSGKCYGLLRNNTELIIEPLYKDIDIYPNGFVVIKDKSLQGLLRWDGEGLNWMFPMIYRKIRSIHRIDNNKFLVIVVSMEYILNAFIVEGFEANKVSNLYITDLDECMVVSYNLNSNKKTVNLLYKRDEINYYT